MALPKIEYPVHEVYLKSLNRKVKFRPFTVKEEKILLIAKESKDAAEMKSAVEQILQNCCLDDTDIKKLPLFDVEMFFINLRMKSVGESVKLTFKCENKVNEETCNKETEYSLDLNKIRYVIPENVEDLVQLTDTVGIKLKYPTMSIMDANITDEYSAALQLIMQNMDYIYDQDTIIERKDVSDAELEEFLNDLSIEQIDKIRAFFASTPTIILEDSVKCEKCGYEHKIMAGDLYSFFI